MTPDIGLTNPDVFSVKTTIFLSELLTIFSESVPPNYGNKPQSIVSKTSLQITRNNAHQNLSGDGHSAETKTVHRNISGDGNSADTNKGQQIFSGDHHSVGTEGDQFSITKNRSKNST